MKKLRLSKNEELAGVCGGIAEYFNISPLFVRMLWIFGLLFSTDLGFMVSVVLYIFLMCVMHKPYSDNKK